MTVDALTPCIARFSATIAFEIKIMSYTVNDFNSLCQIGIEKIFLISFRVASASSGPV